MDSVLVLVLRGDVEQASRLAADRLGDVPVLKVFTRENETILHVEAPLGHEVYRWFHEAASPLIWFNYREDSVNVHA